MSRLIALVAVGAASAYTVVYGLGGGVPGGLTYDVYGYFYPQMLYALRSLWAGGGGLLWNPFQNCGQPFLGVTETGLFYPANAFFLFLSPPAALRAVLSTNLMIGGLGCFYLARQLGVTQFVAIAAAVAFTLDSMAYQLTTWMPTVQAPYVWMPVVMLFCERLMQAPSVRYRLLLGMALAAGLMPGHPQIVLFTCQLVALRLLWSLTDRAERRHFARAASAVAGAMVVMLLLTAVQYLSSLEVIAESIRGATLRPEEIAPKGSDVASIAEIIREHQRLVPFSIIAGFLAPLALVNSARRRIALFYFLAGFLFLILSFGFSTPLGRLYFQLPISGLFRQPMRFRIVTAFCASVLCGLAIDELARGSWRALGVAAASLAGLYLWLGGFWPIDSQLAGVVLGGGLLAAALPAARPVAMAAIVGTVILAPILVPAPLWRQPQFADGRPLHVHEKVLSRLQRRLTPQDRVQFALPRDHEPRFLDKTAMLFQLPAIGDYEMQVSQRYAEYSTMLRNGTELRSLNQAIFPGQWNPYALRLPLVDLAAARYLVIDKSHEPILNPELRQRLRLVDGDRRISVYEFSEALPRAYYVPRIAVEANGTIRLRRLALGSDDRRRLALVGAPPASGFLGVPGNDAIAEARFVLNDPEHVVIETVAPEHGFLFLADQYFPAWSATVNGQPAPIMIANHAFRLVEVPQGPVTVEFRYRSYRFWIGALVSALTLAAAGAFLVVPRRARSTPSYAGAAPLHP